MCSHPFIPPHVVPSPHPPSCAPIPSSPLMCSHPLIPPHVLPSPHPPSCAPIPSSPLMCSHPLIPPHVLPSPHPSPMFPIPPHPCPSVPPHHASATASPAAVAGIHGAALQGVTHSGSTGKAGPSSYSPSCLHPPIPPHHLFSMHQHLQALQPFGLAGTTLAGVALTGDVQAGFLHTAAMHGAALQSFRRFSSGSTNSGNINATHTRLTIVRVWQKGRPGWRRGRGGMAGDGWNAVMGVCQGGERMPHCHRWVLCGWLVGGWLLGGRLLYGWVGGWCVVGGWPVVGGVRWWGCAREGDACHTATGGCWVGGWCVDGGWLICDSVVVAKMLGATLVLPLLDNSSWWADGSTLPNMFDAPHFIRTLFHAQACPESTKTHTPPLPHLSSLPPPPPTPPISTFSDVFDAPHFIRTLAPLVRVEPLLPAALTTHLFTPSHPAPPPISTFSDVFDAPHFIRNLAPLVRVEPLLPAALTTHLFTPSHPAPPPISTFSDVFDAPRFIRTLAPSVRVVPSLPATLKDLPPVVRTVPKASSPDYYLKHVRPLSAGGATSTCHAQRPAPVVRTVPKASSPDYYLKHVRPLISWVASGAPHQVGGLRCPSSGGWPQVRLIRCPSSGGWPQVPLIRWVASGAPHQVGDLRCPSSGGWPQVPLIRWVASGAPLRWVASGAPHQVLKLNHFKFKLNYSLPAPLQKLRCKANYEALRFVLVTRAVARLTHALTHPSPLAAYASIVPGSPAAAPSAGSRAGAAAPVGASGGPAAAATSCGGAGHGPQVQGQQAVQMGQQEQREQSEVVGGSGEAVKYEPDMLAFTGCDYGGGRKERKLFERIRKRWLELPRQDPKQQRAKGKCLVTPPQALGFPPSMRLYIASGELHGGGSTLRPLSTPPHSFPLSSLFPRWQLRYKPWDFPLPPVSTSHRVAVALQALGFPSSTRLYIASGELHGGPSALQPLLKAFPFATDKYSLARSLAFAGEKEGKVADRDGSRWEGGEIGAAEGVAAEWGRGGDEEGGDEEGGVGRGVLEGLQGRKTLLAAVDYEMCRRGHMLVLNNNGNMAHLLSGHKSTTDGQHGAVQMLGSSILL
ncbi:unnamed protein product [Closterium sp. Naga37s-1]|nr:unnamed protein product [Closterium sp. Naga37s-1]